MTVTEAEKLGFVEERKVLVEVRRWDSLQRLCWKMKRSLGFVEQEALSMLAACRHAKKCPGATNIAAPCLGSCPDRERRLSALMLLANAREFLDVQVPKLGGAWQPPTREFYDQLVGELANAKVEAEELRSKAATEVPPPPPKPTSWWRRLLGWLLPHPEREWPALPATNGLQSQQARDIEAVREAIKNQKEEEPEDG